MFAPMGPEFLADPYPAYERLRALDPVLWVPGIFGIGAWVVTDHATCNAVLRDKRFGKQANKVLPPRRSRSSPRRPRRSSSGASTACSFAIRRITRGFAGS